MKGGKKRDVTKQKRCGEKEDGRKIRRRLGGCLSSCAIDVENRKMCIQ